ncbi:MAG: ABC transporter permease [Ruminococcus sp.]|nr:ABC transporter permease [Ruminococcus sp.]
MIYPKLAFDTMRKNTRMYVPYIISNVLTVAMLYIMGSLSVNPDLQSVPGGDMVSGMLGFGNFIMYIFCTIFLIYTSNFISRQRRKEFGLYSILGMEKRHIARIIVYENIFTVTISLVAGLGAGIVLEKLAFLTILKVLGQKATMGFYISINSLVMTSVFFAAAFLLITVISIVIVRISKPLELIKSSKVGEREPKTRWIMAILGVLCLVGAYYISVTQKDVRNTIPVFFGAVVLVIVGTYLVFMAGSIALLKLLKRNKKYYYKTKHFISVSGLMYRMKQNALGLASICILSTMVLVIMSSTISLLAGLNDMVNTAHPYDLNFSSDSTLLFEKIDSYLAEEDVKVADTLKYEELTFMTTYDGSESFTAYDDETGCLLWLIPCDAYNALSGENISLGEHQAAIYDFNGRLEMDKINILGVELDVKEHLKHFSMNGKLFSERTTVVLLPDADILHELEKRHQDACDSYAVTGKNYLINLADGEGRDENEIISGFLDYYVEHQTENDSDDFYYIDSSKSGEREDLLQMFSGLFFIGVFLGVIFLMETILIIYYKQISEGYEDKKRFDIMQNVGLSQHEVKTAIHSQVLTVFFLPLVTAGIHILFAFPIIRRILELFRLTNTLLFAITTVLTFVAFAIVYAAIYLLTAKTYYKIVKK